MGAGTSRKARPRATTAECETTYIKPRERSRSNEMFAAPPPMPSIAALQREMADACHKAKEIDYEQNKIRAMRRKKRKKETRFELDDGGETFVVAPRGKISHSKSFHSLSSMRTQMIDAFHDPPPSDDGLSDAGSRKSGRIRRSDSCASIKSLKNVLDGAQEFVRQASTGRLPPPPAVPTQLQTGLGPPTNNGGGLAREPSQGALLAQKMRARRPRLGISHSKSSPNLHALDTS